ncbi:ABC transporter permease [Notoacmeibacter sp. MSK16QG-6]|uniref:ABC transporter permease n=1 Tax=Notoacmeibacter sp. MSK16QG-6 TaxID=2957982 RepID=UPI00209DDEF8|nr:ABC transporter permease subunit [Notoacmeibacter sp. MSK16QG-6]MCP1199486.1 ABC transporter permease subunit [Notoacmeibacter sp. MSK16QG-6]
MENDILPLLGFGADGWGDQLLWGAILTVSLALSTLPLGLTLGFLVALGRRSEERSLRFSATLFTTIFRGLPELLTLFLIYYGVQIGLSAALRAIGIETVVEINAFAAGMIALGLVFAAYASEVFISAFAGIADGQSEASRALGIGRLTTMRRVIMPQLFRLALPGLGNLWLILLKDTALVSVIGLSDILRQSSIAARVTQEALLFYSIACLIYLVLSLIFTLLIGQLERRFDRGLVRS